MRLVTVQPWSHYSNKRGGYVLLVIVLIMGAILSVISISTALMSLSNIENVNLLLKHQQLNIAVAGCAEEALLHLRRDDSYTGEVLNTDLGTCEIVVTGALNNRTVAIAGTLENLTASQTLTITLNPLSIITWDN